MTKAGTGNLGKMMSLKEKKKREEGNFIGQSELLIFLSDCCNCVLLLKTKE